MAAPLLAPAPESAGCKALRQVVKQHDLRLRRAENHLSLDILQWATDGAPGPPPKSAADLERHLENLQKNLQDRIEALCVRIEQERAATATVLGKERNELQQELVKTLEKLSWLKSNDEKLATEWAARKEAYLERSRDKLKNDDVYESITRQRDELRKEQQRMNDQAHEAEAVAVELVQKKELLSRAKAEIERSANELQIQESQSAKLLEGCKHLDDDAVDFLSPVLSGECTAGESKQTGKRMSVSQASPLSPTDDSPASASLQQLMQTANIRLSLTSQEKAAVAALDGLRMSTRNFGETLQKRIDQGGNNAQDSRLRFIAHNCLDLGIGPSQIPERDRVRLEAVITEVATQAKLSRQLEGPLRPGDTFAKHTQVDFPMATDGVDLDSVTPGCSISESDPETERVITTQVNTLAAPRRSRDNPVDVPSERAIGAAPSARASHEPPFHSLVLD